MYTLQSVPRWKFALLVPAMVIGYLASRVITAALHRADDRDWLPMTDERMRMLLQAERHQNDRHLFI